MTPLRAKFLLLWIAVMAWPGPAVRAVPREADIAEDPGWQGLFASLAAPGQRWSSFEERRTFAFRRNPVVLTGEVRISRERGLSLHYLTPKPSVVIVDGQGVLLRDAQGRERAVPKGGSDAVAELVDVLRFDLTRIAREFELRGKRAGEAWSLSLVPRKASGQAASIVISGVGNRMGTIEIASDNGPRVEIRIKETREEAAFTPAELARYFR